jgi:glutathione S-transferase
MRARLALPQRFMATPRLTVTGRSSSHFTRIVRVFAHELGVAYELRPVLDLMALEAHAYGGNPALRLPVLETAGGAWFGTLNICRELERHALQPKRIAWPEHVRERLANNAQELVLQSMSNVVVLVMRQVTGELGAYDAKAREGLEHSVAWLERHFAQACASLPPDRELSFLEVSAFCFIAHLEFRKLLELAPFARLRAFRDEFGERASARATEYRFDAG